MSWVCQRNANLWYGPLVLCFFFFGDWRKSMRAHNEKHRKKLAWPYDFRSYPVKLKHTANRICAPLFLPEPDNKGNRETGKGEWNHDPSFLKWLRAWLISSVFLQKRSLKFVSYSYSLSQLWEVNPCHLTNSLCNNGGSCWKKIILF